MVLDLSTAPGNEEEMGARESHILILWIFECGHAIECGCRHEIGLNGFCIICSTPRKITGKKKVDYHLSRPRKAETALDTPHHPAPRESAWPPNVDLGDDPDGDNTL